MSGVEPNIFRVPREEVTDAQWVEPRTAVEASVCKAIEEVLAVDRVGTADTLVQLGGGSLDAVRVAVELRNRLSRPVEVTEVILHATVLEIAQTLDVYLP